MIAVRRHQNSAQDISAFIDAVDVFARDLPDTIICHFTRKGDDFNLQIEPPSSAHRAVTLSGHQGRLEYALGKVWTEGLDLETADLNHILAALDAVRDGKVKEATDRRTGLIYHVYRLDSRGLRTWLMDGQYSMWNWLRLKIRRVQILSLPPLAKPLSK